jgi:hypothetical protein
VAHITFIHGISNKPEEKELLRRWTSTLGRSAVPIDLEAESVSSTMVYWADVLYDSPLAADEFEAAEEMGTTDMQGATPSLPVPDGQASSNEAQWIAAMEQRLGMDREAPSTSVTTPDSPPGTLAHELERIPLPAFAKDAFLKRFLRDVHHYLFNTSFSPRPGTKYQVQDEIRERFISAIKLGASKRPPHIVVSHSMGTVIAYDCLKRVDNCPQVDALITIGSPLGIDEIQDKLQPGWTRDEGFPALKVKGSWLNYFDRLDVVSRLDPYLANDFRRQQKMVVGDIAQENIGVWRHDIEKYLLGPQVSKGISEQLGL